MFKTRVIYSCDVLNEVQRRESVNLILTAVAVLTFIFADVVALVRDDVAASLVFLGLALLCTGVLSWRAYVGITRYRAHYHAVHVDDSHDVTDADR